MTGEMNVLAAAQRVNLHAAASNSNNDPSARKAAHRLGVLARTMGAPELAGKPLCNRGVASLEEDEAPKTGVTEQINEPPKDTEAPPKETVTPPSKAPTPVEAGSAKPTSHHTAPWDIGHFLGWKAAEDQFTTRFTQKQIDDLAAEFSVYRLDSIIKKHKLTEMELAAFCKLCIEKISNTTGLMYIKAPIVILAGKHISNEEVRKVLNRVNDAQYQAFFSGY